MRAKNKILTKENLKKFVDTHRKKDEKIVFTNGVFDILHAGHVSLLEFAKNKGDVLILGLNTDASVRRLKGPTRPVNKQADRALVAAALEAVDGVVLFGEDTPLNVIKIVRPDVLVKGGDYNADDVVGKEFSGRVVIFPTLKGRSTTNTIKKIKQ
ncbi:D-beta-D-heptose 7-phosphate kinase / D-beta-D-heptose 1-phosphate adenosyltransferase [Parelusimicrobium proximum]|uniref:adenylyltransferase/cytidyltransferase family protein n=1 Tax=Parelusimicrobium proximum TaxID=3228953 RepID=UPI003D16ACC5